MGLARFKRKLNLLGDGAVGKTSLIYRFTTGGFDQKYVLTLGTEISKKTIQTKDAVVESQLWDVMGQKGFDKVKETGFLNSHGAIAVCDVTRKETLYSIESWISAYQEIAGNKPVIIAVNKTDLEKELWQFSESDLESLLKTEKIVDFFMTSAAKGAGVNEAFTYLAELSLVAPEGNSGLNALDLIKKGEYKTPEQVIDGAISALCFYSTEDKRQFFLNKVKNELKIDIVNPNAQSAEKLLDIVQKRADKIAGENGDALKYVIGTIRGKYESSKGEQKTNYITFADLISGLLECSKSSLELDDSKKFIDSINLLTYENGLKALKFPESEIDAGISRLIEKSERKLSPNNSEEFKRLLSKVREEYISKEISEE